ncbi:hypothetical protein BpHYR1_045099 [Brachionus plicatilis]|uniref:Uncharacterized protein n=1 Tax=Brachionus plicatilis TaxID=10195 RepID=A0A3M7PPE6_BRAPC|nr:hypothetical protein BpHYR1_045099 [Brachionus plicatilis]
MIDYFRFFSKCQLYLKHTVPFCSLVFTKIYIRFDWETTVVSLCFIYRTKISMNIPLERKRRPGRPKATTNALIRQPNETQVINDIDISSGEESV